MPKGCNHKFMPAKKPDQPNLHRCRCGLMVNLNLGGLAPKEPMKPLLIYSLVKKK